MADIKNIYSKNVYSFRLDADLIKSLDDAAFKDGRNRTNMLTIILRKYFSKADKKRSKILK